jgi:RES domain-containing protein
VPTDLLIEKLDQRGALPQGWTGNQLLTQSIGNTWLDQHSTALLEVPSALVSQTNNYLLNPLHSDAAKIVIAHTSQHPIDKRLLRQK